MSVAENEARVRRYWEEAWSKGDLLLLDGFYASTFLHDIGQVFTPERFKRRITATRATFPDLQIAVDDLFSAGEHRVVSRVTYTGTMLGPMGGAPATGKKMQGTGIDIFHFRDGVVVEHWHEADHLSMMEQIGLIPDER
jgi:steroid delta-isomerase-like uncharacterized protein